MFGAKKIISQKGLNYFKIEFLKMTLNLNITKKNLPPLRTDSVLLLTSKLFLVMGQHH